MFITSGTTECAIQGCEKRPFHHTRPGCEETIHFKTSRLQPSNDTYARANGIWL